MLLSSFLYGVEPTVRQLAVSGGGVAPVTSQAVSYAFLLAYTLLYCLLTRSSLRIGRRDTLFLLGVGALGSGVPAILLVLAYQYMPVGCATVLHFLYPTVVCAASALILHERLSGFHLLAVVLSITGLACISLTSFEASATGIVLAVLSALAYAFYLLALGRRPCGGVPLPVRMFYVFVGGAAITLALLPFFGPVELPPAGAAGALALAGLLSMAAAGMLLAGLRRLSSTTAAFFCLLEPVTSVVLSTVVFRYDFTAVMIAGCALIGASMLCVCAADLRAARRKEARA